MFLYNIMFDYDMFCIEHKEVKGYKQHLFNIRKLIVMYENILIRFQKQEYDVKPIDYPEAFKTLCYAKESLHILTQKRHGRNDKVLNRIKKLFTHYEFLIDTYNKINIIIQFEKNGNDQKSVRVGNA